MKTRLERWIWDFTQEYPFWGTFLLIIVVGAIMLAPMVWLANWLAERP